MVAKTDYTVEKKEEIRQLGKGGEVTTSYRIWATSKAGTYFHLDIPEAELAQADARLTAKARLLDSV